MNKPFSEETKRSIREAKLYIIFFLVFGCSLMAFGILVVNIGTIIGSLGVLFFGVFLGWQNLKKTKQLLREVLEMEKR